MWKNILKIPIINVIKNLKNSYTLDKNNYPYNNSSLFKNNSESIILPVNIDMKSNIYELKTNIKNLQNNTTYYEVVGRIYDYIYDDTFIRKDENMYETDDPEYGEEKIKPYIVNNKVIDVVAMFVCRSMNSGNITGIPIKETDIYLNNKFLFRFRSSGQFNMIYNRIIDVSEEFKNNVITYGESGNDAYSSGTAFIYFYFDELDHLDIKTKIIKNDYRWSISYDLDIRYMKINKDIKKLDVPYNILLINNK